MNPTVYSPLILVPVIAVLGQTHPASSIKLNEIQVIGTHNSYHIEPAEPVMSLIRGFSPEAAASIAYTHQPMDKQLGKLGIRQLEWDLYADPEGGRFAEPAARGIIESRGADPGPSHDPHGVLLKPGFKIIHSPDFDFLSTSLTFRQALETLRTWSTAHPNHVPVLVLLEMKESGSPIGIKPIPFDEKQLAAVDQEILSMFPRDKLLTPDDVRGDFETLREAIVQRGWPLLDSVRGQIMFALDNGGTVRDTYLKQHPSLRGRLLFASVGEEDPAAAWFKINDPIRDFDRIQRLVRAGFMVRTRADSDTRQSRDNDPDQREKAFASGAQFVSTDYPEPNQAFSEYRVRFPDHAVARPNPISEPPRPGHADLEGITRSWIVCAGTYGGHLQGVATDGSSLYWSHTVQLVKTDLEGNVMHRVDVPSHHGDLTWHAGKVFVATELGRFNQPPGQSDPWVYVYDAGDLTLLTKHRIPELVHGAGGIAYHDGRFVVVGGLPADHQENLVVEYDEQFRFVNRHLLPSGQTKLGIQTAAYMNGHWWFGCYGAPKNPGLLQADEHFRLVGQSTRDFSYGIERLTANVLRGETFADGKRGKIEVLTRVEPVTIQVQARARKDE